MMIVNEEYKLNKEWLDLILENKNNANLTFNLSDNDTRILLTYIEVLKQENARLKDKIERSFKIVDDKLTNLNLEYGINNEFREEYDELWEILKEN
jgi:hypothetical protein